MKASIKKLDFTGGMTWCVYIPPPPKLADRDELPAPFGDSYWPTFDDATDFFRRTESWCETEIFDHDVLTVESLMSLLSGLEPQRQIVIDDMDAWWNNIAEVELPNTENGLETVVLRPGKPLDTRQF